MTRARLVPHVDTACESVEALEAAVQAPRRGVMSARFVLTGDLRRVRIPAPGPQGRVDELWRHTCFETFVRRADMPGYLELNFSPSGAWQAYRFAAYRQDRVPAALPSPPHLTVWHRACAAESTAPARRANDALVLEVIVPLPAPYADAPQALQLGLSAVVEHEAGVLSYWALRHAPGRPDFHHPDAFALTLGWTRTPPPPATGSDRP